MRLKSIAFIDIEVEPNSGKILDMGGIKTDGSSFHSSSIADFRQFFQGAEFICGHNIINHDLKYLRKAGVTLEYGDHDILDTLFLSPLLFPAKPYHALVKDDKLQTQEINNPLNDSIKAKDLFFDEVAAFQRLDSELKQILALLLQTTGEFGGLFKYLGIDERPADVERLIAKRFHGKICERADLSTIIEDYPIELAYCLALINTGHQYSINPPWITKNYPNVKRTMHLL